MVMARREVLVQLDDELVEQLDRMAKALDTNRSELLRRGAQAVIDADAELTSDIELIAAYKRQPPDAVLIRSAARLASKTAPTW
jgi:metal-responsive CopG/Arc/MetJ family transcriptional regulator